MLVLGSRGAGEKCRRTCKVRRGFTSVPMLSMTNADDVSANTNFGIKQEEGDFMKTLALINSTAEIKEVLQKATEFSNGDILEVLFVYEKGLFGLPDLFKPGFVKDESIDKEAIKKEIKTVLKELNYKNDVVIFIYIDGTISRVEAALKDKSALIVTKYNKTTAKLAEKNYDLLYLKNGGKNYEKIAIVLNLSPKDAQLIDFAKKRFKSSDLELVYDYLYAIDTITIDPLVGINAEPYIDTELKEANKNRFNGIAQKENLKSAFLEGADSENLIEYINANRYDLTLIETVDYEILDLLKSDVLIK